MEDACAAPSKAPLSTLRLWPPHHSPHFGGTELAGLSLWVWLTGVGRQPPLLLCKIRTRQPTPDSEEAGRWAGGAQGGCKTSWPGGPHQPSFPAQASSLPGQGWELEGQMEVGLGGPQGRRPGCACPSCMHWGPRSVKTIGLGPQPAGPDFRVFAQLSGWPWSSVLKGAPRRKVGLAGAPGQCSACRQPHGGTSGLREHGL